MLNDLVHTVTSETEPKYQIEIIARTIVDVFSRWGVHDCTVLLPDAAGMVQIWANAYQSQVLLSRDEQDIASWVMAYGQDLSLYEDISHVLAARSHVTQRAIISSSMRGNDTSHYSRFVPLRLGLRMVGVLHLRISNDAPFIPCRATLLVEKSHFYTETNFFWTFLDQVASLIDCVHLDKRSTCVVV